jgi:hypothetical protein
MNESLGSSPTGEKIQWQPGIDPETGERKPLSPALPPGARWAARERRRIEAKEASRARGEKNRKSIVRQVGEMEDRLGGRNVMETLEYIDLLSPHDREIAILAEERGQHRKSILERPGNTVSEKVRDQFRAEQGILDDVSSEA